MWEDGGKIKVQDVADVSNSSSQSAVEKDIMSTVLKGYYQLFLPQHAAVSATSNESIHAEMATVQLYNVI